jgi:AcrR family transcriptional regulator
MKRSAAPVEAAKPRKARGRPRSFDRDAALEAAMEVFWSKGFEATSISDLTEAMDINPPSLYSAFGDKEKLFLEAIESYSKRRGESCPYADEPTARGAIEKLLQYMARDLAESSHPRGCLMMMAAATSANASPSLQKILTEKRLGARDNLRARIKQGIEDGDVPAGTDATSLADFYSTVMMGMSLQAKDGVSRKSLLATVQQAMQIFPAIPASAARKGRESVAA